MKVENRAYTQPQDVVIEPKKGWPQDVVSRSGHSSADRLEKVSLLKIQLSPVFVSTKDTAKPEAKHLAVSNTHL